MLGNLEPRARRLYLFLLAGFAVFGIVFTIIGASIPNIIRSFGWSYSVTGLVLAGSAIGYFVSTFVCGFLVQRVQPKHVVVSGLALGAISLALFARSPSPILNFALTFLLGLCQGTIEVVTNLEVIHMEPKGQSRLMNLMHAAFSIGAIVGPAMVGVMIGLGVGGAVVFSITGGLVAAMGIAFASIAFPRASDGAVKGGHSGAQLLRQPLLLLLTLMLLVYVGAELGVSSWVAEYFVKVLSAPIAVAAFTVSLFWAGLFVGRLGVSFAYRGTRQELILLGLSAFSAAALGVFLLLHSMVAAGIFVFLTGLGYSAIYPLVMALVGKHFKSGVAVGTASTGGGIGSFTFPFVIAVLFEVVGLRGGFGIYIIINILLVGISLAIIRRIRS